MYLIELLDYIADDNAARADAFIGDVDAKFQFLAEQPMLGRSREDLALGLRSGRPADVRQAIADVEWIEPRQLGHGIRVYDLTR